MAFIRRTAAATSIALLGLVAFSLPSVAGGGGGGGGGLPAAGNYQNATTFADVQISGPSAQITVNVTDTTSVANPLVGPSTSTHEVDVFLQACDFATQVCGSGCIVVAPSDFTFSSDMTSATLNTTVPTNPQACQGNPLFGLTPPFTLQATWSAAPGGSFRSLGRYACDGYTSETVTTSRGGSGTTATASISLIPDTTFGPSGANLFSFNQTIHAQGSPADSCVPLGGKGAGPGPQGLGEFSFSFQTAALSFLLPSQGTMNVSVSNVTTMSHPQGGTVTTHTETDLNVFEFAFPNFISACFVIPSSDFSLSPGQAASVNASIDASTPACQGSQGGSGLPSSFTVQATWSAVGALSELSTDTTFTCGGLTNVTSSSGTDVGATASGGFSGVADSFSASQASLFTNATTFHFVRPPTC